MAPDATQKPPWNPDSVTGLPVLLSTISNEARMGESRADSILLALTDFVAVSPGAGDLPHPQNPLAPAKLKNGFMRACAQFGARLAN
jgi:hypothetical protein